MNGRTSSTALLAPSLMERVDRFTCPPIFLRSFGRNFWKNTSSVPIATLPCCSTNALASWRAGKNWASPTSVPLVSDGGGSRTSLCVPSALLLIDSMLWLRIGLDSRKDLSAEDPRSLGFCLSISSRDFSNPSGGLTCLVSASRVSISSNVERTKIAFWFP